MRVERGHAAAMLCAAAGGRGGGDPRPPRPRMGAHPLPCHAGIELELATTRTLRQRHARVAAHRGPGRVELGVRELAHGAQRAHGRPAALREGVRS